MMITTTTCLLICCIITLLVCDVPGVLCGISSLSDPFLSDDELVILRKHELILLNIGGISPAEGWINVNVQYDNVLHNVENTDYILRNMSDLYGFRDESVSILYSSHTLEHVSSTNGQVLKTLLEWKRVLRPGGMAMVAVPDLHMLAKLYIEDTFPPYVHEGIAPIIYGGQRDQYDFHVVSKGSVNVYCIMTL